MKNEIKIKISDINQFSGLHLSEQLDQSVVGLTSEDPVVFIEPISVDAHVQKIVDSVLVNATVKSRFKAQCYRTLEDVKRDWSLDFILDVELGKNTEDIDLTDDIRQEIILNIPMRVLSDAEEEKDKLNKKRFDDDDLTEDEPDTYKPFEKLKDV